MTRLLPLLAAAAALACLGCDSAAESSADTAATDASPDGATADMVPDTDATTGDTTYWQDAKPLLDAHCAGCHGAGGIGEGFARFDNFDDAAMWIQLGLLSVESGRMPPWQPDETCRSYQHERTIPVADVAVLQDWFDAGTPEGDPSAPGEALPVVDVLTAYGPPDASAGIGGAFLPVGAADIQQCFPLDFVAEGDTWLELVNVVADNTSVVHHALVYAIPPGDAATLDALDAADPDLGYECFSGLSVPGARVIGAWVPGFVPMTLPDDSAFRLEDGERVAIQIHYNTLFADGEPDQTRLDLWTRDTPPTDVISMRAFRDANFLVEAHDPAGTAGIQVTNTTDEPWNVIGAAPHMHLLGTSTRMSATHADGEESCLVDIPAWDYDWQQLYRFAPGAEVVVAPGEQIALECIYDNTAANQPIIDGIPAEVGDVRWGDGTTDEMCITYLLMQSPLTAPPPTGGLCGGGFASCMDTCPAGVSGCTWYCAGFESAECRTCLTDGFATCAGAGGCTTEAGALQDCLDGCTGSVACARDQCAQAAQALDTCVAPALDAAACTDAIDACGVDIR